jgi:hypothetical protein
MKIIRVKKDEITGLEIMYPVKEKERWYNRLKIVTKNANAGKYFSDSQRLEKNINRVTDMHLGIKESRKYI